MVIDGKSSEPLESASGVEMRDGMVRRSVSSRSREAS